MQSQIVVDSQLSLKRLSTVSDSQLLDLVYITLEKETIRHIGNGRSWELCFLVDSRRNENDEYIIFLHSEVIGYLRLKQCEDSYLLRIFISEKYQRRDYGTKIITNIASINDSLKIVAKVYIDNTKAVKFFRDKLRWNIDFDESLSRYVFFTI